MSNTISKILVAQPAPTIVEKSPFYELSQRLGVEVDYNPLIKVIGITPKEFRSQRINILDHTAVIFTSRTTIDSFFHICEDARITVPETMKYFCVSESVALYLQKYIQYRKRKVFFGATGKLSDLIPLMTRHLNEKYMIVVSDVHNEEILSTFQAQKIEINKAIMYKTVSNDFGPDEPFDYDMLVFFSPAGIAALKKNFPNYEQGETVIGCLGANTAQAAREAGLRLDIEVPSPQYPSMTMAIDAYLKENHKRARK